MANSGKPSIIGSLLIHKRIPNWKLSSPVPKPHRPNTCCTIIKLPASRIGKFSVGRTKCRSPVDKDNQHNSLDNLQMYKENFKFKFNKPSPIDP